MIAPRTLWRRQIKRLRELRRLALDTARFVRRERPGDPLPYVRQARLHHNAIMAMLRSTPQ